MTNDQVRQLIVEAYIAGFAASGEGYNGEWWSSTEHSSVQVDSCTVVPERIKLEAEEFAAENMNHSRKVR